MMSENDDDDLWNSVTEDVTPLSGTKQTRKKSHTAPNIPLPPLSRARTPPSPPLEKQGRELDRKTEQKLIKGKMTIEGRIDLHGMTQEEAYPRLIDFIHQAYQQKKRCVLVITGKGKGILKTNVPQWLMENSKTGNIVLKSIDAQPKDGGAGALYVYLRKDRP